MALDATPLEVYPLSSPKGGAIPLAVARPKGGIHINLSAGDTLVIDLPEALNLVTLIFDHDLDLWTTQPTAPSPANNTYIPGLMILSADISYDLALPARIYLVSHHSSVSGYANVIERWAQLQTQLYEAS